MIIRGAHSVAASPARVFDRLLDPAVLKQCIPGCDKLEKTGENEYAAHLKLGIGAIKGSYAGRVRISDQQPPHRFTMHLSGEGGPGFVKGTSSIELSAAGNTTSIAYSADVQVGGLIAAVGTRVVEAVAKKLAGDFFRNSASGG